MPTPPPYMYAEGGGKLPPYGEDFFQRIVGVNWPKPGGILTGFFVAGSLSGSATYNRTRDSSLPSDQTQPINTNWYEIGGLDFTSPPREYGAIYASTYSLVGAIPGKPNSGKSVFLLGGYRFHEEDFGAWNEGIIMASNDGVNWQKVHSFVGIPYQDELVTPPPGEGQPHHEGQTSYGYIHSIVWDGKQFWAGGYLRENVIRSPLFHFTKSDNLFVSSDGFSWSPAGQNKLAWTNEEDEPDLPTTGLLARHCSDIFTDSNGNGVPGGVWDEDTVKKIKIVPVNPPTVDYTGTDDRSPYSFVMSVGTNSDVRIISKDGEVRVDTGVPGVMGVAFAGGVWWAVGSTMSNDLLMDGSAVGAFSVNDGKTWTLADIGLGAVATTVSGAA